MSENERCKPLRFRPLALLGALVLIACPGSPEADEPPENATPDPLPTMESPLELTLETDREVYAPGDSVELTLSVRNPGAEPVTLSFPDAQRYDFRILDAEGETLWRWSDDRAFAQVLGEERLASGESLEWRERYEGRLPSGEYGAVGTVPATDRPLEAETSFRIRSGER